MAGTKKNVVKPWLKEHWCLPAGPSAAFVCAMEDVLDVYERPYDPRRPQVCVDETSKQLVGHLREPLPPQPGMPERIDHQYVRNGVANVFMVFEPLAGRRHVKITARHTRSDWAYLMKDLVDTHYPDAEQIVTDRTGLRQPRNEKSPHGPAIATMPQHPWTGASPSPMPASN